MSRWDWSFIGGVLKDLNEKMVLESDSEKREDSTEMGESFEEETNRYEHFWRVQKNLGFIGLFSISRSFHFALSDLQSIENILSRIVGCCILCIHHTVVLFERSAENRNRSVVRA